MADETPQSAIQSQKATPLKAIIGSAIAGVIASVLWQLTSAIAVKMALTKLVSDNMIAMRVSVAVRTLVVGMSALATGIFTLAALGLFGLCIQMLLTKEKSEG
jgi:hypothetical protein